MGDRFHAAAFHIYRELVDVKRCDGLGCRVIQAVGR